MRRYIFKLIPVLLLILGILVFTAGCGQSKEEAPTPAQPQEEKPATMQVTVYYVKMTDTDTYLVRETHTVPYTLQAARAALEELISNTPVTEGAFRVLPSGTMIRGINIKNGLATVDFSREVLKANVGSSGEAFGIQSIVNTLTEFPSIKQVAFQVEGGLDQRAQEWWGHVGLYDQPFHRNLDGVGEPVIWVTEPLPKTQVTSPLTVRGSARVFEATVSLRLVTGDGRKLAESCANATAGAPQRGDFVSTLSFTPPASGNGFLEVFWVSPQDGSELNTVRVPVQFGEKK